MRNTLIGNVARPLSLEPLDVGQVKLTLPPDPGSEATITSEPGEADDEEDEAAVYAGIQGTGGGTTVRAGSDLCEPVGGAGGKSGQLKTWRLELLAAGPATAIAQTKAEAAELAQLRRDNRRLKEENEVMRKASAFSLSGRRRHERQPRVHPLPGSALRSNVTREAGEFHREAQHRGRMMYPSVSKRRMVSPCQDIPDGHDDENGGVIKQASVRDYGARSHRNLRLSRIAGIAL